MGIFVLLRCSIELPLAALPGQSLPNLRLSMGLTNASDFLSTPGGSLKFVANLSIMYQTDLLKLANMDLYRLTNTTQTLLMNLTTPFTWDGLSNIVMDIGTNNSAKSVVC